ncbi:MAG: biopolymer transporter ExbD [Candidatus Latescibacteria bacterium]|nr:biopolymer transporter ExbD [Candidatus Latescibacterota bacterium]
MAKKSRAAETLKRTLRGGLSADINVTPFIDVLMVLLIFFLVITPIILFSFNAELPQAGAAASAWQPEEEFVLTLTDNHVLQVNGVEVSEEGLVTKINEFFTAESKRERKVIFNGGKKASYERVMRLLDLLKKNGIEAIGIR